MKKTIWTETEKNHLINGLRSGASLSSIRIDLSFRTDGAVLHKANTLNYGHDTDPDTGEIYFRAYIKYIKRRTKQEIEMEIQNGHS